MRYALVLLMSAAAIVSVWAERLSGVDWVEMKESEKITYIAGYLDGRVSEVSNVVVLGLQLSSGGQPIAEDQIVGAFINVVNERGKIWSDLDFKTIMEAIDRAIANNKSMLDSALFLFVQEALTSDMGVIQ